MKELLWKLTVNFQSLPRFSAASHRCQPAQSMQPLLHTLWVNNVGPYWPFMTVWLDLSGEVRTNSQRPSRLIRQSVWMKPESSHDASTCGCKRISLPRPFMKLMTLALLHFVGTSIIQKNNKTFRYSLWREQQLDGVGMEPQRDDRFHELINSLR